MNEVRLGMIGCGGMAQNHMRNLEHIEGLRYVAAADPVEAARQTVEEQYGVKTYADGHELIQSGEVDAVLIATPHYHHPTYAIHAFENGVHVLTEKPVAVSAKAAQQMNEAADRNKKLVYAAMFQMRDVPRWKHVKQLLDDGEIGPIQRVSWTITGWFRTQAYYDSGGWRATWAGEGGGVLLNQCPHNLDLFTWFFGLPNRVQAQVGLGKYHDIEVEDDVTAMMTFDNGATGTFVTSSGQAPGINRLEIVGDRSTLVSDHNDALRLYKNHHSVGDFLRNAKVRFGAPPHSTYTIEPGGEAGGHRAITQNFINAIRHGEPVIAPGRDGLKSLELSNAMLQSGIQQKPIDLPMDRDAFDTLLQELIDNSTYQKPQPAGSA